MLMGYGASVGKCRACNQIKAVGDMELCRECCLKKITESELVCKDCLQEDGSNWMPDGKDESSCVDCGEYRVLDENFVCKSCHDKKYGTKPSLKFRQCWNCQDQFAIIAGDDHFCLKCRPNCYGCHGYFNPETRDEVFCDNCLGQLEEGCCTLCGSNGMEFNHRGHCKNCATKDKSEIFCSVCEVEAVEIAGGVCKGCAKRQKWCPRCKENMIEAVEYICEVCKSNEQ
jgi:hypothetical protein